MIRKESRTPTGFNLDHRGWVGRTGMARVLSAALMLMTLAVPLLCPAPVRASAPSDAAPSQIAVAGSQVRVMRSASGRTYRVYVWSPPGPAPAQGRPVIYVLDGETTFMLVRDTARSLAAAYPGSDLPVVVALGYDTPAPYSAEGLTTANTERTYDYTPAVAPEKLGASFNDQPWPATGGADAFLDFIEDELKPAIESGFAIDRSRQTLMGHSFGGLFTLHALFSRPDSFSTYVASSPSVWYGSRYIEQALRHFTETRHASLKGKRLLLTVGGLEQSRVPERGERARAEWLAQSRMVDGNRELAANLQALAPLGLETRFRVFEGESHLSVKPPASNYGVRFAMLPAANKAGARVATREAAEYPGYAIPRSEQWVEKTGQGDYTVSVLLPAFPPSLKAPESGYPLVYFLGAGQDLGVFADTMRRLEGGGMTEPAILVGIGNAGGQPGAAAQDIAGLLELIERRITPRLRQQQRINPARRALIGHGAEAALVLRSLYTRPEAFDSYAVLSPAADAIGKLRDEERNFIRQAAAEVATGSGKRLFLAAGDAATHDFPGALQGEDDARIPAVLQALAARLQPLQSHALETRLRVFAAEDNTFGTTAIAEALLFNLDKEKLPVPPPAAVKPVGRGYVPDTPPSTHAPRVGSAYDSTPRRLRARFMAATDSRHSDILLFGVEQA